MTRKFKHKHTGAVVIKGSDSYFIIEEDTPTESIPAKFIENSNDWEEVVQKKYLFTTHDGVKIYKGMDSWSIYKDLSISPNTPERAPWVGSSKYSLYFSTEEAAQKYIDENTKKIVFTTHDGVPMYVGDSYCFINKYNMDEVYDHTVGRAWSVTNLKQDSHIRFSTRKAAQQFIDKNTKKPILRTEDGVDLFEGDKFWYVYIPEWDVMSEILSEENEESIDKDIYVNFSTKQAAKDYVNLHAPKFSKKEILDILDEYIVNTAKYLNLIRLFNCKDK